MMWSKWKTTRCTVGNDKVAGICVEFLLLTVLANGEYFMHGFML